MYYTNDVSFTGREQALIDRGYDRKIVERLCILPEEEAERAAAAILSAAQAQAEETRKNAEKQAESYWAAVSARLEARYREDPELRGKLWDTER